MNLLILILPLTFNLAFSILVSDSTNCLPAFKIMSSKNTDMELRLFSYDAFYNMFNGKVISRYDDNLDQSMNEEQKLTYLKTGYSGETKWKDSVNDSHKEIESFLNQSFKTLEKAIDQLYIAQSEVCLENNENDSKYLNSNVKPLTAHNFDKSLQKSQRYSIIKVYSHSCRGCQFIEQAYIELADKYQKDRNYEFYDLHTSTEGVPIVSSMIINFT